MDSNLIRTLRKCKQNKVYVQKQVVRGETDLGINFLAVTGERSTAVDFSLSMIWDRQVVWVKTPKKYQGLSSASSLLFMLSPGVWVLFGVTGVLAATAALMIEISNVHDQGNIALSVFGLFMGQGTGQTRRMSIRILFLTCLAFGIMFMTVFSARLASTLSVQKQEKEITSLSDLKRLDYDIFVQNGSFYEGMLKRLDADLWRKAMSSDVFHPSSEERLLSNFLSHNKVRQL